MTLLAWIGAAVLAANVGLLALAVLRYLTHEPTTAEADARWKARMVEQARRNDRAQARVYRQYAKDSHAARRRIAR